MVRKKARELCGAKQKNDSRPGESPKNSKATHGGKTQDTSGQGVVAQEEYCEARRRRSFVKKGS
jgi:hypothetical protein